MITTEGLKDALVAKIDQLYSGSTPVAPDFYLQVIKDYMEHNAEVTYMYTGVTPTGAPDPNSGVAKGKLSLPILPAGSATKAFVKGITEKADPTGLVRALIQDSEGQVIFQAPHTGVGSILYTVKFPVSPAMAAANNYREAWEFIADAVVKSFLALTTAPIPTVTPAGTGTSTFTSIS